MTHRSKIHYKMNKDQTNLMRNINNKLRKNYRILCAINSEGETKIARNKMANKGYDFEYCTSICKTKTGNTYYFMYDYLYLKDNKV